MLAGRLSVSLKLTFRHYKSIEDTEDSIYAEC